MRMEDDLTQYLKKVAIPIIFLVVLVICLPFDKSIRFPWILEFGPTNSGRIASSLVVLYSCLLLSLVYLLLGKVPLVAVPFLSLLIGLFASDYWELPRFILVYPSMYRGEVVAGVRHALSFLWSSFMFHLFCGLLASVLLKIRWSKRRAILFLSAPWIMYAFNVLFPIERKPFSLGILGNVAGGVIIEGPNRIVCWAVLLYILSNAKWRGFSTGKAGLFRLFRRPSTPGSA